MADRIRTALALCVSTYSCRTRQNTQNLDADDCAKFHALLNFHCAISTPFKASRPYTPEHDNLTASAIAVQPMTQI